jgi:hypothetical protein
MRFAASVPGAARLLRALGRIVTGPDVRPARRHRGRSPGPRLRQTAVGPMQFIGVLPPDVHEEKA